MPGARLASTLSSWAERRNRARAQDATPQEDWIEREFAASGVPSLTVVVAQDGRVAWERSWARPNYGPLSAMLDRQPSGESPTTRPDCRFTNTPRIRMKICACRLSPRPSADTGSWSDHPANGSTIPILAMACSNRRSASRRSGNSRTSCDTTSSSPSDCRAWRSGPRPEWKGRAVRYGRNGAALPFYEMDARGASSFYASAHDLARFAFLGLRTLEEGQRQILSDASLATMTRPTSASPFGIGWQIDTRLRLPLVLATGHMDGVGAILLIVPGKRLVIVRLCNAGTDVQRHFRLWVRHGTR